MIDLMNRAILNSDNENIKECPVLRTADDRKTIDSNPVCTNRAMKMHGDEIKNIDFAQPIDGTLVFIYPNELQEELGLSESYVVSSAREFRFIVYHSLILIARTQVRSH